MKPVRYPLLGLILIVTFGCGAAKLSDVSSPSPSVTISNFHQVDSHLYRSGRPTAKELSQLTPLSIKTVLSLEAADDSSPDVDDEEKNVQSLGMKFFRFPWSNNPLTAPTIAQIDEVYAKLNDPLLQPVLVHCYYGSDRTGIAVGAYHIRVDHWTADQAIADMRNFGHSPLYYGWDSVLYDVH